MLPSPVTLTFDLLTLKMVSESRVTWATSRSILVFLALSVFDLDRMYATDRQTDRQTDVSQTSARQTSDSTIAKLMPPPRGRAPNSENPRFSSWAVRAFEEPKKYKKRTQGHNFTHLHPNPSLRRPRFF